MGHILSIEPDWLLAETYRQTLELQGHSVMICASAQSAIYGADKQSPDLVVMELQLIGHSGIEFLYEFRSYNDWQQTPVIVLSNVPAGEFAGSWELLKQELNVRAYLYKPLTSLRSLLASVNEAMALSV